MTRKSIAARALVAGIALTAMGLMAAAPASAHTNNLYTHVENESFATIDRTTADVAALPTVITNLVVMGAEIADEVGTAILRRQVGPDVEHFLVAEWNHDDGSIGSPQLLFVDGAQSIEYVGGLDTTADGTLITYVHWFAQGDEGLEQFHAIATLDRATGELTPLIPMNLLLLSTNYRLQSFATDPITGVTYAFVALLDDPSVHYYLQLDLDIPTVSPPVQFSGAGFEGGIIQGADFDADGTLYFLYSTDEGLELSTLSTPLVWSTWQLEDRNVVATAGSNIAGNLSPLALTFEHTDPVEPALAATGGGFASAWLIAGGVAVLAGATAVLTARKRGARAA